MEKASFSLLIRSYPDHPVLAAVRLNYCE